MHVRGKTRPSRLLVYTRTIHPDQATCFGHVFGTAAEADNLSNILRFYSDSFHVLKHLGIKSRFLVFKDIIPIQKVGSYGVNCGR